MKFVTAEEIFRDPATRRGLPMAIDLLLANSAASRFISGTVASFPVALLVWVAVESLQLRPLLRREEV